jgi:transposase
LSRKWLNIFKALAVDPAWEWRFMDGSYVKAHQHSAGAASQESQAIGKSRAGNTTKIHLAVDGYGLPVEFEITGGEVNDCSAAPDLIARLPDAKAIVADKGYDSEWLREQITKKGAQAVIPRKRNSLKGNADMDWGLYKYRHLVENAFARLKQYRAIATRYDKLKRNYESRVAIACRYLWLPTYVKCQHTLGMALITLLVTTEKIVPGKSQLICRIGGALLIAWGIWSVGAQS